MNEEYFSMVREGEYYLIVDDKIISKGHIQKLLPIWLLLTKDVMVNLMEPSDIDVAQLKIKNELGGINNFDEILLCRIEHKKTHNEIQANRNWINRQKAKMGSEMKKNK